MLTAKQVAEYFLAKDPVMNLEENIDEYKKRYKGLIEALKI